MSHTLHSIDKPVEPCPFCGAEGTLHKRGNQQLLKMEHDSRCWFHHPHQPTYQMITESEYEAWQRRDGKKV